MGGGDRGSGWGGRVTVKDAWSGVVGIIFLN